MGKTLKEIVRNNIYKVLCEAKQRPFDFDYLAQLIKSGNEGFSKAVRYCTEVFGEPIGNGGGRVVFQIDDTRVFKLAKNEFGIAQNKREYMAYAQHRNSPLLPIVFNDSDLQTFMFLVSEYVIPINNEDIYNLYGIEFQELLMGAWAIANNRMPKFAERSQSPKLEKLTLELIQYKNCGGELSDFKPENLGIARRNNDTEVVILDSGI